MQCLKPSTLRPGGEGEMAHNRPQALIRPNVRDGSIAAYLFSLLADLCPLLVQ
jgi:hypothetical protein